MPLLHEEIPTAEVLPENNDQAAERIPREIEIDDDAASEEGEP